MGNFRSDSRGGFGGRSGGFRGDRGGYGGRGGDRGERRRPEMHEATCDKCKKQCEVPFRPTGDKPVYCSDCFRKEDSGSSRNFSSGNKSDSISPEQFKQLNTKLDKILKILEAIEFEDEEDFEEPIETETKAEDEAENEEDEDEDDEEEKEETLEITK